MYKSGKLWVTAAVLGLSVMAGMTVSDQQVKADDQTPVAANTTTQPATTSQNNATTPSTDNQGANQQPAKLTDNQGNQQPAKPTDNQGNQQPAKPTDNQDNQQPAKPADNQGNQQPAKPTDSQGNQQTPQKESIERIVNYLTADGRNVAAPTKQTAIVNKTVDGDKTTYDVKKAAWESAILPTPEGMHATYNGQPVTAVPTEVTLKDGKPDTSAITITFVQNVLNESVKYFV